MFLFFTFGIAVLATYGTSKIISEYDGPYSIFTKIRNKYPLSPFLCVVCTSVYLAVPISVVSGLSIIGYLAVIGSIILIEVKS